MRAASGFWTTYMQLKNAEFGRGKPGTQVTLTVRRGEEMVEMPITRGLVAYRMTHTGTNADYQQAAVWTESGFARFKDGKVSDLWFVSDDMSLMKQLGYVVKEPEVQEAAKTEGKAGE